MIATGHHTTLMCSNPRKMGNSTTIRRYQNNRYCWVLILLLWLISFIHVINSDESNLELQEELLKFLGMERRTGNTPRVASYMQHLYNKDDIVFNTYEDQNSPNYFNINNQKDFDTIRSIANVTEVGNATQSGPGIARVRVKFALDEIPGEETLRSAQLRVTHSPKREDFSNFNNHPNSVTGFKPFDEYPKKHRKSKLPYVSYLRVYDVIRELHDGDQVLRLLDTTTVDRRISGVITLDVGLAVSRWLKKPSTNHGIVLEMSPQHLKKHHRNVDHNQGNNLSHLRLKRQVSDDEDTWNEIRPAILMLSDSGVPKSRKKRSKPSQQANERCQRRELFVDFETVEWRSWILAPRGYDAFYCSGRCEYPLADHMNTTNHAIIQTLVNSRYPNRVPKSCCIPTELSPISLLYIDKQERVILKNYQNMVVEACGCR